MLLAVTAMLDNADPDDGLLAEVIRTAAHGGRGTALRLHALSEGKGPRAMTSGCRAALAAAGGQLLVMGAS